MKQMEDLRQRMHDHEKVTGQNKSPQDAMNTLQNHRNAVESINSSIADVVRQAQMLNDHMMTPPMIVRDESGRAVGVRKGKMTYRVVRDQNGKAVGLE